MKPAFALCYDYSTPFEDCARQARDAGFEVVSLGMKVDYSGFDTSHGRKSITRTLAGLGLTLDNVHGAGGMLSTLDEAAHGTSIADAIMSVEAAAELGADTIVQHLSGAGSPVEALPREIDNARRAVEAILSRARALDVVIAVENSWPESYMAIFRAVMEEFDDPLVRFCYDTSHDQLYDGRQMRVLREYGERLAVLHVSDNRGEEDDHLLPREGVIDWERFTRTLASLPYGGDMLLEGTIARSGFKDPDVFTREAYSQATQLIRSVEGAP